MVDQDNRHVPARVPVRAVRRARPRGAGPPRSAQLDRPVRFVRGAVDEVRPEERTAELDWGLSLPYDQLVIATGTSPRPEEVPGMDGRLRRESIFDFYTLEGATALREALRGFTAAACRHVTDMPIKCPVAPGVRVPRRGVPAAPRHPRPCRADLRHPAAGRVHQAGRRPPARPHARRAWHHRRAGLPRRADRRGPEGPGVVRRARGAVRPAGHRAAQQGRRLRGPLRARRRAQLRPGRPAHVPGPRPRRHLRDRRRERHPTSKAGLVAHFWWTCSPTTSSSTSRVAR